MTDAPPVPGPATVVAALHREHYADLVRMAALMVDQRPLAEEIVQDSFAELFARWDRVAPGSALAYLRRSIANGCRSALRRRRTVRRNPPPAPTSIPAADEKVLQAAGFAALLAAVAALPLRQRQVLVLRYYTGISVAETAAALSISETAVTASAHRAIRALAPFKEDLR